MDFRSTRWASGRLDSGGLIGSSTHWTPLTVTTILKGKKKKKREKTLLTYYAHTNYYIFKAPGLGNVFKIDLKV